MVAGLTRRPEGRHAIFKILLILRIPPPPRRAMLLHQFEDIYQHIRENALEG